MNIKDLAKMPKRKVTVSEILRLDGINDVINYLEERKADIGTLIIGIQWEGGGSGTWLTNRATRPEVAWLLDQIKYQLLQEAMEED